MKKRLLIVFGIMVILCMVICGCTSKYESLVSEAGDALSDENYKEAIKLCNEAVERDDERPEAYEVRGKAFYEQEKYGKAVKDYKKAISRGSDSVYGKLGYAYLAQNDTESAEKYMKKQLKYDDQDVDTYLALIEIYNDKGMYREAQELKSDGYDATGDSRLEIIALTEDEAKEVGGVYVLAGDKFYLPQSAGKDTDAYKYVEPQNESIPVLCDGDKLVFFSPNDLEEAYPVYPVDRTGYTFPLSFSEPGEYDSRNIYGLEIDFPVFNESDLKYDEETIGDRFTIYDVESVNDMSFREYYESHVPVKKIAEVEQGDTITYAYHDGTEYKEDTLTADLKFYHIDTDNQKDLTGSFSKTSYGELDTSPLSAGTYVIPFEKSKKTLIYFKNEHDFIFRVEK